MSTQLVPNEVDLRDFAFMPLDVIRLRDSGLTAKASGDEFRAAVLLWCASWHQQPAASLPNDDEELANLCGYSRAMREWMKIRRGALRGWIECSDGRLYHPMVAAKALEAWKSKLAQRARTEAARRAREESRQTQLHGLSQKNESSVTEPVTENVTESKGQGQGQGQGQEVKNPKTPKPIAGGSKTPPASETASASRLVWNSYAIAYMDRYGTEPVRNAKVNGQLANLVTRLPKNEAPAIAAWYVTHSNRLYVNAGHCVDLLLRDAEKLRTEWATGNRITESGSRQTDRAQTTANAVNQIIAERGAA